MKIEIRMEKAYRDRDLQNAIREAAKAVGKGEGVPAYASLTILVTGDEDIRALNKQFLDMDAPTDVLAFPGGEPLDGEDPYLGDIIISLETARRQADAGAHSISEEVQLLTVHGILHLLGHDHGSPEEKVTMWSAQAAILQSLNNPLSPP